jgi:hypothetical protein
MTLSKQAERIYAHHERKSPSRKHGIIVLCCYCKRQRVRGHWMYAITPPGYLLSHGACPACVERVLSEAKKHHDHKRKG